MPSGVGVPSPKTLILRSVAKQRVSKGEGSRKHHGEAFRSFRIGISHGWNGRQTAPQARDVKDDPSGRRRRRCRAAASLTPAKPRGAKVRRSHNGALSPVGRPGERPPPATTS